MAKKAWPVGLLVLLGLGAVGWAIYSATRPATVDVGGGVKVTDADLRTAYSELCETRALVDSDRRAPVTSSSAGLTPPST